ncbi:PDDEXK nuclease domain-containing protein [Mucilaginibacter arboris]|uniref:PDDEXK nuclease domain-containing protein n=1 Tax=Mucilaginibacter arboris TaxID=2682090 RepID=UPI0018DE1FAE|nr:PDDEXK nuclease domain-containing protein [Mucilaginibacter arboris]
MLVYNFKLGLTASDQNNYFLLLDNIGNTIQHARIEAIKAINTHLVKANWEIGRHIVEYEQDGSERAEYGSDLLSILSKDLKLRYGKGFGRRNVLDMRRFYLSYQKWQAVPAKLSWTHIVILLGVSDVTARKFYEIQSVKENWGTRELERQVDAALFERLALISRNKASILELAEKGHAVTNPKDITKDPYILDFLQITQAYRITEKQLEQKIIENLQLFLLELGKGFAFIARQYKISLRNNHFYIDLVFYHRILKCFVLIDLKIRKVQHNDIGQMNLYLNYFKKEENVEGDNEPIGIILSADKDEILVEYATGGITNNIFVSKYQLYLPDKEELQRKVAELMK